MVTALDPTAGSTSGIGNVLSTFTGSINFGLLGGVAVALVGLTLIFLFFKFFKGRKSYNILIEVTPKYAFKTEMVRKQVVIQPTRLERAMGKKAKIVYQEVPQQISSCFYAEGAYVYNKNNGTYELHMKNPNKTKNVIYGIDYGFFKPILFGKFKRAIGLWQEGPNDFKPYHVSWKGQDQIRNVYDSESTWVAMKSQEEVRKKFVKESTLQRYLPIIIVIIVGLIFIVAQYLFLKKIDDVAAGLEGIPNALGQVAKQLAASCVK